MVHYRNLFKTKAYIGAGVLMAGMVLSSAAQAELLYSIADLGTLGGEISSGFDVNNAGQVTGYAATASGNLHAFVIGGNGQMADLGTLGGTNSYGYAINDAGRVTGKAETGVPAPANSTKISHAFVTNSSGQMTDLGTLGGLYSYGTAINSAGLVIGNSGSAAINGGHGFYSENSVGFVTNNLGQMTNLSSVFGKDVAIGSAINDAGQILVANAGQTFIIDGNGQVKDVGNLGGSFTLGRNMNNSGQVTGVAYTADGSRHVFVTDAHGQILDLGAFTEIGNNGVTYQASTVGWDINSAGQVVGGSDGFFSNLPNRAFVTDNGVMKDLNTLLVSSATDWQLNVAHGINDAGQITGWGLHNGLQRAFLLTPIFAAVPVPAAVWLMGSALLGYIGTSLRRRK